MDSSSFDLSMEASVLAEYVSVIGCSVSSSVDELIAGHLRHLRYNNERIVLSDRSVACVSAVDVSLSSLRALCARGGFCFQHNNFMAAALAAMHRGRVTLHAAVTCGGAQLDERAFREGKLPPYHSAILLHTQQQVMVVDVGFAKNALRAALPVNVEAEGVHVTSLLDEQYQITVTKDEQAAWRHWLQIDVSIDGNWFPLYRLNLAPMNYAECEQVTRYMFCADELVRIRDSIYCISLSPPNQPRKWLQIFKGSNSPIDKNCAVWRVSQGGRLTEATRIETWDEFVAKAEKEFGFQILPELKTFWETGW